MTNTDNQMSYVELLEAFKLFDSDGNGEVSSNWRKGCLLGFQFNIQVH